MAENNKSGNNEQCTCGMCSGHGIGEILEMLSGTFGMGEILEMLSGNMSMGGGMDIGIGMMIMGSESSCNDPECNRAECQNYRWKKDDKITTKEVFEDEKVPVLLVKLPHHRKIEKLISLRKHLPEAEADQIVWKKIVEDHIAEEDNKPIFEQLSNLSRAWLRNRASKAISATNAGERSGRKVIKEVTTLDIFIEVMAGKKTYKNEAFSDQIKETCEMAINRETELKEEIDRITAELPEELKEATKIPTLSISLERLEELVRNNQ